MYSTYKHDGSILNKTSYLLSGLPGKLCWLNLTLRKLNFCAVEVLSSSRVNFSESGGQSCSLCQRKEADASLYHVIKFIRKTEVMSSRVQGISCMIVFLTVSNPVIHLLLLHPPMPPNVLLLHLTICMELSFP